MGYKNPDEFYEACCFNSVRMCHFFNSPLIASEFILVRLSSRSKLGKIYAMTFDFP